MLATIQTRLRLSASKAQMLDRMADLYGSMKRKLYARIAAHDDKAKSHKTAFCREHGISTRMFNAMAIELQGLIEVARELLLEERSSLGTGLRRQESQLGARRRQLAEIAADRLQMKPEREAKLRRMTHRNVTSLARLEWKLRKVDRRLAANVPGIFFGTRRLFGPQHYLEPAGFDSREAWLREWQTSRSHQMFFVGSKDEAAGNQLCQLQRAANDTYTLKVRVPDRLLAPGDDKYLVVCNVTFGYDRDALDQALEANVALNWRLHRDERGWRAFVSFADQPAETTTLDVAHGAIGIDFNVDHLAVTETDPLGNLLQTKRFPLPRENAGSGQRNAVLSDALSAAVR